MSNFVKEDEERRIQECNKAYNEYQKDKELLVKEYYIQEIIKSIESRDATKLESIIKEALLCVDNFEYCLIIKLNKHLLNKKLNNNKTILEIINQAIFANFNEIEQKTALMHCIELKHDYARGIVKLLKSFEYLKAVIESGVDIDARSNQSFNKNDNVTEEENEENKYWSKKYYHKLFFLTEAGNRTETIEELYVQLDKIISAEKQNMKMKFERDILLENIIKMTTQDCLTTTSKTNKYFKNYKRFLGRIFGDGDYNFIYKFIEKNEL